MSSLISLSVRDISNRIACGQLSPVELVDGYLQKIEAENEYWHAYVEVYSDEARVAAARAEQDIQAGNRIGPLHGVPIAIKDVLNFDGHIMTGGSALWRTRRATGSATVVRRLLEQGAIILGKTHTVEFALGAWGTNRTMGTPWNPWDLACARTPGGSSSGSAVAVAAGLAPWAIGTDTGGSIRVPASWCGVTGFKVSTGRISMHGIMPLSKTLDTAGPMARSVDDLALLYEALKGPDPSDPRTLKMPPDTGLELRQELDGLRIARLVHSELEGVDAEVVTAYEESLDIFRQAGAEVLHLDLPYDFTTISELNTRILLAEGYAQLGDLAENPGLPLDEDVRARLLSGRNISTDQYQKALARRKVMQREIHALLKPFDAFLTPTTETAALRLEEVDQSTAPTRFTRFANFFGLCALALPNGLSSSGLPLSLQIMTGHGDENSALRIGYAYQQLRPWSHTVSR